MPLENRPTHNINNPIDIKNGASNVDYRYGPYLDKKEALDALVHTPGGNYNNSLRGIGRTVLIGNEEYWFRDGIEDGDLIRKYPKHFGIVNSAANIPKNPIQGDRFKVETPFNSYLEGVYYYNEITSSWILESKDGQDGAPFTYSDFTPQQLEALRGPKGDDGTSVRILGEKSSQGELPVGGELGDGYLITGDLWVWNGTEYTNVGTIKGPKGDKGIQGDKGEKGDKGLPFLYGDFTPQQLAALKGEKGDPGQDGADGQDGVDGADGPTYVAGSNITIDNSDPNNPIISSTIEVGGMAGDITQLTN